MIPIILNNHNTFAALQGMVEYLKQLGEDIFIVDNNSTYPPLLDWYATKPVTEVFMLGHNRWKHHAPWRSLIVEKVMPKTGNYVVSDPDLDLTGIPLDVLDLLHTGLQQHARYTKAGLSLRLDDIPDANPLKHQIVNWERQWWTNRLNASFYSASIDTTFAMYRVGVKAQVGGRHADLRAAPPYCCRHIPWYVTEDNLTDEDIFRYSLSDIGGHWSPRIRNLITGYAQRRKPAMVEHITYSHFALADKQTHRDELDGYAIPHWSRKYEYPWAAKFAQPDDVVLDACCGWEPTTFFKYWLAKTCKKVYAVDSDPQLKLLENPYPNLEFIVQKIGFEPMPVPDNSCDKVYCISALEHIRPAEVYAKILEDFYRVLKPGGMAIITVDVPDVRLPHWLDVVNSSQFKWHGQVDQTLNDNHLSIRTGQHIAGPSSIRIKRALRVFCTVLKKPEAPIGLKELILTDNAMKELEAIEDQKFLDAVNKAPVAEDDLPEKWQAKPTMEQEVRDHVAENQPIFRSPVKAEGDPETPEERYGKPRGK